MRKRNHPIVSILFLIMMLFLILAAFLFLRLRGSTMIPVGVFILLEEIIAGTFRRTAGELLNALLKYMIVK